MSDIFPQGGLSQAYTALTRFAGVERNTTRSNNGQSFAAEVDKSDKSEFSADEALSASPRLSAKEEGFKEYFVASTTSYDPNAPRGSYVNIVV
jgi:hypothetical protein